MIPHVVCLNQSIKLQYNSRTKFGKVIDMKTAKAIKEFFKKLCMRVSLPVDPHYNNSIKIQRDIIGGKLSILGKKIHTPWSAADGEMRFGKNDFFTEQLMWFWICVNNATVS